MNYKRKHQIKQLPKIIIFKYLKYDVKLLFIIEMNYKNLQNYIVLLIIK